MDRFAYAVILSWGWRRRGLALAAGALSSLAQPPFFAFPILWVTFPVLIWLLDGAVAQGRHGGIRRLAPAFATGWWFGFGYFLAGLWWVGTAFLVEAEKFAWLIPAAVLVLPAGLALFWGLGTAAAQLMWSEDWRRIFALAAGLGGAEWLRGHVLTGFPWNMIGYALTAGEVLMQSAALFGLYALNVIAVIVFAAPAVLAPASKYSRNVVLPTLAGFVVLGFGIFGFLRLANADTQYVPDTLIRVVQPALEQMQKWDPDKGDEVLAAYLRLSATDERPLEPGTVLVWPETAFPFALTEEPGVLSAIAELLPPGTALVTGAYRTGETQDAQQVFNAIYVVGDDGTIRDAYDKVHLVPFGEFLPYEDRLSALGLRQLVRSGFSAGPRRHSLNLPTAPPFSPLICYEIIFPDEVLPEGPRPGFLLNLTNDGWFGRTIGPYQHFHQARVRGVEEGLPLVRAANTGISSIVDSYGRIVATARLGEATTIEARLPKAVEPPFNARWRHLMLVLALLVSTLFAATHFVYRAEQRSLT
jgi:apolipoprotein N-acyltransferase